jgi:multiple sugar transport system ATP-binding protein
MGDVKLENVYKRYEDVTAVEDMNIHIRDGEFVCLVGPSGCGKSTTMEMVAGLTIPSEGSVYIGGREVTNLPPKDRGIAMVFQNIALFPHMDVYDNVSFGLRLRDFDKEEIDRRVERAAEIVQITNMLDRMPDEMSGGQRQRVAIARAIVRNPDVFLMDEPLANLDAKLRVHMRTELQRLHKELQTTIIYVTHDQAEAMTMSDRIAVIDSGSLQQIDPPLVCYNEPANMFVATFIGSPSMNMLDGRIGENGWENDNISVDFDPAQYGLSPGDEVAMGIRPEDVYPVNQAGGVESQTKVINADTDVMEPMGDETFVYLLLSEDAEVDLEEGSGSGQLLISVSPDTEIEEDEGIEVVLDRSKVHLFDRDTGEAVQHGLDAMTSTGGAAEAAESDD